MCQMTPQVDSTQIYIPYLRAIAKLDLPMQMLSRKQDFPLNRDFNGIPHDRVHPLFDNDKIQFFIDNIITSVDYHCASMYVYVRITGVW